MTIDSRAPASTHSTLEKFSRYETGKTKTPLALVKLFKVLDRHPDLLEEIRMA